MIVHLRVFFFDLLRAAYIDGAIAVMLMMMELVMVRIMGMLLVVVVVMMVGMLQLLLASVEWHKSVVVRRICPPCRRVH
jgi:hypothetical protein